MIKTWGWELATCNGTVNKNKIKRERAHKYNEVWQ